MDFTTDQWNYIFNCISLHGNRILAELAEKRAIARANIQLFPCLADDFNSILADLETASEIQLSLLPKINLGDRVDLTKQELLSNQKLVQQMKEGLDEIFRHESTETTDNSRVHGTQAQD